MEEQHRLDADAEGFEEDFDDADDESFPHVQEYYAGMLRRLQICEEMSTSILALPAFTKA